jgi:hypothetical protein
MEEQNIEKAGTKAEIGEEEIIDAELNVQAFDLLEEALERFGGFLQKMRFMLRQIEIYDVDEAEDNNETVKSVILDLIISQAGWVCLIKGKMAEKAEDAKRKLDVIRKGAVAKAELLERSKGVEVAP